MASFLSKYAIMATFCLSITSALASPMLLDRPTSTSSTGPSSAIVVWYQATEQATSTTCGLKVSDGTIQANECYTLRTAALGIQQDETFDCTFKVWDGVSDCSGNGSSVTTPIPKGNAATCIHDDVLDGGEFQHKSGVYSCL